MAKKQPKDYSKSIKARADLFKVASEVASIDDHFERMNATSQFISSAEEAENKIALEHQKYARELIDPESPKAKKLYGIYTAVEKKAGSSKKGILPPSSVDEFVAQVAGEIMPHIFHYEPGKKGDKVHADAGIHAVESMKYYFSIYDQMNKGETDTYKEVKSHFAKGNALEGTRIMVNAVIAAKKMIETKRINDLLFPEGMDDDQSGGDNYKFMMDTARKIKEDVEAKTGKKVDVSKIARDRGTFMNMYHLYAKHMYGAIAGNAKPPSND